MVKKKKNFNLKWPMKKWHSYMGLATVWYCGRVFIILNIFLFSFFFLLDPGRGIYKGGTILRISTGYQVYGFSHWIFRISGFLTIFHCRLMLIYHPVSKQSHLNPVFTVKYL